MIIFKKPISKNALDQSIYDEHYFRCCNIGADWIETFISSNGTHAAPQYKKLIKYLSISRGHIVLDIGCGRGEVASLAGMAGAVSIGLDYSTAALKLAQQISSKINKIENTSINFLCSDATKIPFTDESIDRIVLADIVEHLHDWQLTHLYNECRRVLRSGGKMVVHTWPNSWHTNITYPIVVRICRLFGIKKPLNPRKPHDEIMHVNEQSVMSLKKGLIKAGFSISSLWCDHHAPFNLNPGSILYWLVHNFPGLRLFFADHLWAIVEK